MFYHYNYSLFQAFWYYYIHLGHGYRYLDYHRLLSSRTNIFLAKLTNIL
jgi:hypothetical protein